MRRIRWSQSKDERREAVGLRVVGRETPSPPAAVGLTPSEVHAQERSATLTPAQSRRGGVLPG